MELTQSSVWAWKTRMLSKYSQGSIQWAKLLKLIKLIYTAVNRCESMYLEYFSNSKGWRFNVGGIMLMIIYLIALIAWLNGWQFPSVCWSVHHFGPDWNTSTTGWIAVTFGSDTHGPLRMTCKHIGEHVGMLRLAFSSKHQCAKVQLLACLQTLSLLGFCHLFV